MMMGLIKKPFMEFEMKFSKILLGAAFIAALSLGVMGCKSEEDDDKNEMITGFNNDWAINYVNSTLVTSRGYQTTHFQHAGALTQIKMHKDSRGCMGYIWNLKSAGLTKEFFVVGLTYNSSSFPDGKVHYYVSKYSGVIDINADNFGAGTNGTTEEVIVPLNAANSFTPTVGADGYFNVTIDVYEGGTGVVPNNKTSTAYNGEFLVDIYNSKVEKADLTASRPSDKCVIESSKVGYGNGGTSSKVCGALQNQKPAAVYANVYAGGAVLGTWHYADTYAMAEAEEQ